MLRLGSLTGSFVLSAIALFWGSGVVLADTGHVDFRFAGDAPSGTEVTVAVIPVDAASPADQYEHLYAIEGLTAPEARDVVLLDLRARGWTIATSGEAGLTIVSHTAEDGSRRRVSTVGVRDNRAEIDVAASGRWSWGETTDELDHFVLRFWGDATTTTAPGVVRVYITKPWLRWDERPLEIPVELPPSADPRTCAELVATGLQAAGYDAALDGAAISIPPFSEWTWVELTIDDADGGPQAAVELPPSVGCDTEIHLGFSAEPVRGAWPFAGVLGAELDAGICTSTGVVRTPDPELTLYANVVSRLGSELGGVQGWKIVVVIDDGDLLDVTTAGTAAASADDEPPGLRDNGMEFIEIIDPALNGGQRGVVSTVIPSLVFPITLPRVGTESVLALTIAPDRTPDDVPSVVLARYQGGVHFSGTAGGTRSVLTVAGMARAAGTSSARIEFQRDQRFVRGDVNQDSQINIADGIAILGYRYLGTSFGSCLSAADTNDSGSISTTDAVQLFSYLYLGGGPPAPPTTCGIDPTTDGLACPEAPTCAL